MKQLSFDDMPKEENGAYMNYTIWQPETKRKPWAVHVQGWERSGVDVWIYHDDLKNGYVFYKKLKFKNVHRFVDFIRSQIALFKNLYKHDIEIRGIDYMALSEGYRKGVNRGRAPHK